MDEDKRFDAAQEALEHQQRQRMVDWAWEHDRLRVVTYGVETEDGTPAGMSQYVMGACWVDEAAPDRSPDN